MAELAADPGAAAAVAAAHEVADRASLSIAAQTVADASGQPAGVGIVRVTPGGAAARADRARGHHRWTGLPVGHVGVALQSVLAARKPGDRVQARVPRDGAESTVLV